LLLGTVKHKSSLQVKFKEYVYLGHFTKYLCMLNAFGVAAVDGLPHKQDVK
jgi:hypothetical protein